MSIKGFKNQYQFLSNFYNQPFNYNGIAYNSVVSAFFANMTTNEFQRNMIAKSLPSDAIKLYKRTSSKKRLSDKEKKDLMYNICKEKFSIPSLKDKLLATNNEELINETTWENPFWGITNDKGENQLGKILMKIRKELDKEQKEKEASGNQEQVQDIVKETKQELSDNQE
jgi:ribA/ribD-fused uncharacterized protein